jgi:hypothetical protein
MRTMFAAFMFIFAAASPASAGSLPNLNLTPGVTNPALTQANVCTTKWGKDQRHVTEAMKEHVFQEYGLSGNSDPFCKPSGCEIDHLISRELGGADDVKNLWPQSYSGPWNAHLKDRVENRLHKEVCTGTITLDEARAGIVKDWTAEYRKYFGEPQK